MGGTLLLRVHHFAVALYDPANGIGFFAGALQHRLSFLKLPGRNDQQHAQSHVKRAQHFVLRNIAQLLQVLEDRQHRPRIPFRSRRRRLAAAREEDSR